METVSTEVERRDFHHFLFAKRQQAWVSLLVGKTTNDDFGIRLKLMLHPYQSYPADYITRDDGESFYHATIYMGEKGALLSLDHVEEDVQNIGLLRLALQEWQRLSGKASESGSN